MRHAVWGAVLVGGSLAVAALNVWIGDEAWGAVAAALGVVCAGAVYAGWRLERSTARRLRELERRWPR